MTVQQENPEVEVEVEVEESTGYKLFPVILAIAALVVLCLVCFGGYLALRGIASNGAGATTAEDSADRTAPEGVEVEVTRVVVETVTEPVVGEAVRVLASNDEIVVRYLNEDANETGTQEIFVPADSFLTISAEGCIWNACAENPGFVALVHGGPITVTTTVPYGVRHANMAATLFASGTADPQYQLALLQLSDQKALVMEIFADGTVQYYSTNVGDSEAIEDLYLQPTSPEGEIITFDVAFDELEDVSLVENPVDAVAGYDSVVASGVEVCGLHDGTPIEVTNGTFWLSSDGPVTYLTNGTAVTRLGPQSAYGLNATVTISDYPASTTRVCLNAGANYGADGKPAQWLFGDASTD